MATPTCGLFLTANTANLRWILSHVIVFIIVKINYNFALIMAKWLPDGSRQAQCIGNAFSRFMK
jgi:hypothetical protein